MSEGQDRRQLYQIYDDAKLGDQSKWNKSSGALYDLYEPNLAKLLNPAGQFNHGRIVVCGNRIEHWLNGQLLLTAHVGSCDWYRQKALSKFSDVEGFGENRQGKIMFTDHKSEVWYRDLQIRPLMPLDATPTNRRPGFFGKGRATHRHTRQSARWRVFRD